FRAWEPRRPPPRPPAVPAVAGGDALVPIRHLHAAQVVLRDLVALGVDVDAEHARRVQPEDPLLDLPRERRVSVPVDEGLRDLEAPERLDLPLRRAVPDRVRPPQDVVRAE